MRKERPNWGDWRNVVFFVVALVVIAADQFTKLWVRSYVGGQSILEVGFFRIIHAQNTGAAFGLFQDQSFILTIAALVSIVLLLLFTFFSPPRSSFLDNRLGKPALGLILGGTVGNLIDRLRLGYVTDFIDFRVWPAFNIADSAIVVGAIIFAYSLLFLAKAKTGNEVGK